MFWKKKRRPAEVIPIKAPALSAGNPGDQVGVEVAFSSAVRDWQESFDVVQVAERVLSSADLTCRNHGAWLELGDSGLVLQPRLANFTPLDEGQGSQSVTTIEIHHPTVIPDGVFEYQHSVGETLEAAIEKGFDQWRQVDLVAVLDALRSEPDECNTMTMTFPAGEDGPPLRRRAILGPTMHFADRAADGDAPAVEDDHPFCPCCLLTNSLEAFKELLQSPEFYALRLFALRDDDGNVQADCRVNGEDFDAGQAALSEYARSWPEAGYEFRKQYVLLQNHDASRG